MLQGADCIPIPRADMRMDKGSCTHEDNRHSGDLDGLIDRQLCCALRSDRTGARRAGGVAGRGHAAEVTVERATNP